MRKASCPPLRTTPAARRCREIKGHRIPSCLKLLRPALFFGLTPWFCSLELAGHWNTHSPSKEGRQHLEAIIPLLLYLSPAPHPHVRKPFVLSTNLCNKLGKGLSPPPQHEVGSRDCPNTEHRAGKVPPAQLQAHGVKWAHLGQALAGTLRRKHSRISNTKISLLHPCTGMMQQHINALLCKSDALQTPSCFTGTDELLGALRERSMRLHPQPTPLHPQRGKLRRKGPRLRKQEPGGSHPALPHP